jgi:hypothetical protein
MMPFRLVRRRRPLKAVGAACSFAVISLVSGQERSVSLKPPFGPENQLVSPNGAYALFGIQSPIGPDNALWLEDRRTHERKMVFSVTVQTLTLGWSPDSTAFIANDRAFSDVENAFVYDVKTLDRLDLTARITENAGPGAARFLKDQNQHSYFHAFRWLDARHVEVQLYGHTEGTWKKGTYVPGAECFDLRYRVSRDGEVKKLSERVAPVDAKACGIIESEAQR